VRVEGKKGREKKEKRPAELDHHLALDLFFICSSLPICVLRKKGKRRGRRKRGKRVVYL